MTREAVLPGRTLELPGRGTTFVREAAGPCGAPTLILLHGLAATAALNWAGASIALRQRFHVVAMDQRGHGRGIPTRRFRLEDCADDVAALVEQLGVRSAILVGYSMGGPIASLVWRRHPAVVDGLVLVATSRTFREHRAEKVGFAALAAIAAAAIPSIPGSAAGRSKVADVVARTPVVGRRVRDLTWCAGEIGRHDPRAILQAADQLGRFSSREWIDGVDVPTAVVTTTSDRVVRPERQVHLAMAIPSAVLHPVPDGHLSLLGARASGSSEAILDACRQVSRRAGVWRRDEQLASLGGLG